MKGNTDRHATSATRGSRRVPRLAFLLWLAILAAATLQFANYWFLPPGSTAQASGEPEPPDDEEPKTPEEIIAEIAGTFVAELNGTGAGTDSSAEGAGEVVVDKTTNTADIEAEIIGIPLANVTSIKLQKEDGTLLLDLGTTGLTESLDSTPENPELEFEQLGVALPQLIVNNLPRERVFFSVCTTDHPGGEIRGRLSNPFPKPLNTVEVPLPPNIDEFVRDRKLVKVLGKALFWDMQVGSDGRTACATCHFHAGADSRTKNGLGLGPAGVGEIRAINIEIEADDFPFRKFVDPSEVVDDADPEDVAANIERDTSEIFGSQGVIKRNFVGINTRTGVDFGETVPDETFNFNGCNARQVEPRNTPTVINAVFNDRNFWDGRANRFFNGVNPFGDTDPDAQVWCVENGQVVRTRVLLDNASLASQAVGPPLSDFEMSWKGRTFPELGQKMLRLPPLKLQAVHSNDSLLGPYSNFPSKGLQRGVTYPWLITQAFHEKWWRHRGTVDGQFTLMEANFSLFWGIAVMMYERELVSDRTPFDRFSQAVHDGELDRAARILTPEQIEGLDLFLTNGACIECHSGPEFTQAAISQIRGPGADPAEGLIERMEMEIGPTAHYDNGFYNIGVRPTEEDLGVGAGRIQNGQFIPLSLTQRRRDGVFPDVGQDIDIEPGSRIAVRGAFKVPGLRNVEMTGPFFHNGGHKTLEEVVEFYARRADFFETNIDDLDPDVDGIGKIRGDPERVAAVAAFMRSLTDDRVRRNRAPFDHPELFVPNGHTQCVSGVALDNMIRIPEVGRDGGPPINSFLHILENGGLNNGQ